MFVKPVERDQGRLPRREQGLSVKEIARRVGVSVSSASIWVRDVPLTPRQQADLDARNPARNRQPRGARRNAERRRATRREAQEHGRRLARRCDLLHAQGCMLYWAEGAKGRNNVILANADVALLTVFVRFLEQCYGVDRRQMLFSVNCFLSNRLDLSEIEGWWLTALGLPCSCLRKASVNRVSSASKRRRGHTLPYGTGRLVVHSTFVVQSIYGAIQEYSGVDRPEWLDL